MLGERGVLPSRARFDAQRAVAQRLVRIALQRRIHGGGDAHATVPPKGIFALSSSRRTRSTTYGAAAEHPTVRGDDERQLLRGVRLVRA